ncbi:DUF4190 domain-containing protein [Streptomyces sp. NPDC053493]|uniref:DUF4190 domain-containing protein n=1 Tax=Streptomyces sp. NPDC053493 TaxID=3365705 RepID=UPI0037D75896
MDPSQPPQYPQSQPAVPPAPGPYASPGPYGPFGPAGPYGPQSPYGAPRKTTNGLAVASLVSGVVCCLPPLGLVFGLIALPQIKKREQSGKGLAVAGIVLSSLATLLVIVGLVTGGIGEAWRGFKKGVDEAAASESPFGLRKGDCFRVDGKLESYTTDVKTVACGKPHEGEVTGSFKLTGFTKWPGEDAVDDVAEERCQEINDAYALDRWAVPEDVWTYYYLPTSVSWRAGDRTVTCSYATDKAPFTGSLRRDATTLNADQVSFLKAVNAIDTAMLKEPEQDADEDLAENKAWAAEVHDVVRRESNGLRTRHWPGGSAEPVAELVRKLDAAEKQWQKLATAKDADAFWEVYDVAYDSVDRKIETASRTALDLEDTLSQDSEKA